jgi:hypothetical protein
MQNNIYRNAPVVHYAEMSYGIMRIRFCIILQPRFPLPKVPEWVLALKMTSQGPSGGG